MARLERLVHRVLHGHWPVYRFAAISDYLEWRVCDACRRSNDGA